MRLPDKIYPLFFTLLFFAFIVSLIYILKILFIPSYFDFQHYYNALQAFIHGDNPYTSVKFPFAYFAYPPSAILFLLPFTVLPLIISEKIYMIFSFICLFLSIKILFKLFQIPMRSWLSIFLIILILNFFPLKFTLVMGQINIVILLLLTFFIYCYKKNRQYLSGIALAIALSLKIFPALLIPYLLINKRWKILTSVLITLVLLFGVVYITIPVPIVNSFFTRMLPSIFQTGGGTYYFDQSLSAFIARTLHNQVWTQLPRIISITILIATYIILWLYRRFTSNNLLSICSLIILNIILNGSAWQHYFVWLIIPLSVTFFFIHNRRRDNWLYAILGLSYLLMALNLKNPTAFPVLFQSHVFYGAILLYGLIIYLIIFQSDKSIKNNRKR
jgi:alpha-1,2-mannosyltransferase